MGAVQRYRERLPVPELAGNVACVWFHEVAAGGPAYRHRTVPNGCVEISYALGADSVVVSGTQRGPTVEQLGAGAAVVGLRLRPGVAFSLLGVPAPELVDGRVALDELWGRTSASLAERLGEAGSPAAAARLLEAELLRRTVDAAGADPLVSAATRRLEPFRRDDLGEWSAGLCLSPRQVRRRFVAALGFGPKTYQRIRRFQGFLALSQAYRRDGVDLARLARRAGYADQAHLTRESSRLTGLTPRAFLRETWESCGPSHDHEVSYGGLRRALMRSAA